MKVYDVSSPIYTGMPVYKNKPEKQPKQTTNTNGYVTETRLELDVHTGTHVDAPLHMVVDGETIETLPLDKLVGPCKVFDLTGVEDRITVKDIEGLDIGKDDFLLFKTKNSFDEEFNFDFVFVAEDAAAYLAEIGVSGVGVDALGIERSQEGHPTHKTLFASGVIIIEGLRLKDIAEGEYIMCAAPLKLSGVDASPARIVLMDMK
ncbi:cyclase family protein [Sutcliffiella horikoshii]|uniref:Kynurenine formamidase n=1 Tax=Sutcliffiella horikoshii TaxID=79883 RepID=A0A5D4T2S6_9BACI|nr:cyclase family protein [Sutcliffiella horikoshii]TYS69579.1 cyclase family protein [Sutcliffiella horikoshii]